jgi:hexosaminidase
LVSGVCAKAVAKGFRCIFSNQGFWYLDHLDVPWDEVYTADPLEFIHKESEEKLILGGEVCMWGETADASNVQQTIWPRAAAAAGKHVLLTPCFHCACILLFRLYLSIPLTLHI